jgi:hypothetical protein
MFKWKVSRLGSKKERTKQRLNNAAVDTSKETEEIYAKNVNNNNKERFVVQYTLKNNLDTRGVKMLK